MRVLTVRQPWAWAIFCGGKDVENRSDRRGQSVARDRYSKVVGKDLWIHTSQQYADQDAHRFVEQHASVPMPPPGGPGHRPEWAFGAIIGAVHVDSVHMADTCESTGRPCSVWALPGSAHLVLSDPRLLTRAVPTHGRLGLWTPSPEVADELRGRVS